MIFKFFAAISVPAMILIAAVISMGGESDTAMLKRMAGQDQFISAILK